MAIPHEILNPHISSLPVYKHVTPQELPDVLDSLRQELTKRKAANDLIDQREADNDWGGANRKDEGRLQSAIYFFEQGAHSVDPSHQHGVMVNNKLIVASSKYTFNYKKWYRYSDTQKHIVDRYLKTGQI